MQTIDMNQDLALSDAFKIPIVARKVSHNDVRILGYREKVFTDRLGAVANYMAATEFAFVTLLQRVLAGPLEVRMHYGHPDLFDKIFTITRGSVSKACPIIHLNEDIFAGYNLVLRGARVTFSEEIEALKGRDIGFSDVTAFEQKLSEGAAQQCISRDVCRLGRHLDLFRLFSLYHNAVGFWVNTSLMVSTIYFTLYSQLIISGLGQADLLFAQGFNLAWAIQLGLLLTFPWFSELVLEFGWMKAFAELFFLFMTGGPIYFMFQMQTKRYYFMNALRFGGAKYLATGRMLSVKHTPFHMLYAKFGRSHHRPAFQLILLLSLYAYFDSLNIGPDGFVEPYAPFTWSMWLIAFSWLLAPMWFNAGSCGYTELQRDFAQWRQWLREDEGNDAFGSWLSWEEQETRCDKLSKFQRLQRCASRQGFDVMLMLVVDALLFVNLLRLLPRSILTWIPLDLAPAFVMLGSLVTFLLALNRLSANSARLYRTLLHVFALIAAAAGGALMAVLGFEVFVNCVAIGIVSLSATAQTFSGLGVNSKAIRNMYRMYDTAVGFTILAPFFLLSVLGLDVFHTRLMYNSLFAKRMESDKIIKMANSVQSR